MSETSHPIDGKLLRYARQDGVSNWWKEMIVGVEDSAALGQWRRIYWLRRDLELRHECGCEGDTDWICDRCWVLAWARRLGGTYEPHSHGHSHRDIPTDGWWLRK